MQMSTQALSLSPCSEDMGPSCSHHPLHQAFFKSLVSPTSLFPPPFLPDLPLPQCSHGRRLPALPARLAAGGCSG